VNIANINPVTTLIAIIIIIVSVGIVRFVLLRKNTENIYQVIIGLGFHSAGHFYEGFYKDKFYRLAVGLPAYRLGYPIRITFPNSVPPFLNSFEIQKVLSSSTRKTLQEKWDGITLDKSFSVTPEEIGTHVYVGANKRLGNPRLAIDIRLPQMLDLLTSVRGDFEASGRREAALP